jgi:hypothetical protein
MGLLCCKSSKNTEILGNTKNNLDIYENPPSYASIHFTSVYTSLVSKITKINSSSADAHYYFTPDNISTILFMLTDKNNQINTYHLNNPTINNIKLFFLESKCRLENFCQNTINPLQNQFMMRICFKSKTTPFVISHHDSNAIINVLNLFEILLSFPIYKELYSKYNICTIGFHFNEEYYYYSDKNLKTPCEMYINIHISDLYYFLYKLFAHRINSGKKNCIYYSFSHTHYVNENDTKMWFIDTPMEIEEFISKIKHIFKNKANKITKHTLI